MMSTRAHRPRARRGVAGELVELLLKRCHPLVFAPCGFVDEHHSMSKLSATPPHTTSARLHCCHCKPVTACAGLLCGGHGLIGDSLVGHPFCSLSYSMTRGPEHNRSTVCEPG